MRETWFKRNIGDSLDTEFGYAIESPHTLGGAEILGCGSPSDLQYPYFRTCDTIDSRPVEFRFGTEGTWAATDVGIIVVIEDNYGFRSACYIAGTLFAPAGELRCVDPAAPANGPPTLTLGGPWTGTEGATISFSATGVDPESTPLTYAWDFGDGSPVGSGDAPSHSYADNGSYTVTVTVSDGVNTTTATSMVDVGNAAPSGTLQVPGIDVAAGTPFAIAISGATDPSSVDVAAGFTFAFDCENDGIYTSTGSTPNITCAGVAPGSYTVAGRVSDKDGATVSYTGIVTVIIVNLPPVVAPGGPYNGSATQLVTFQGSGTDPEGQAVSYSWDFGDGTSATSVPVKHAYALAGSYTATLTVTDASGVAGSATAAVTIGAPPSTFPVLEPGCLRGTTGIAFDGTHYYVGEGHGDSNQCVSRYSTSGAFVDRTIFASDIRGLHFVPTTGMLVSRTWGGSLRAHDYAAGTTTNLSPNAITGPGLEQSQPAANPDGATYWSLTPTGGPGGTPLAERRLIATLALLASFPVATSRPPNEPSIAVSNYRVYTVDGPAVRIYNKTSGALLSTEPLSAAPCNAYGFGVPAAGDRVMYAGLVRGSCIGARVDMLPAAVNTAPIASVATPPATTEGALVSFDAMASTDADQNVLTYSWTFGDGATGSGATPTHTYADNGSYTVTVTVSDSYVTSTASTTAAVANAAPSGTFQVPGVDVTAGTPFAIAISGATDPSSADLAAGLTFAFDCENDGTFTAPTSTANTLCILATAGNATVHGRVIDKDGAVVTYSASVTVVPPVNMPPTVNIGGPYTATEGSALAFSAVGSDPEGAPLSYSWDFGDGTQAGSGNAPTHSYADNGSYTVTVTVSDGVGSATASANATITNVAPTATFQVPGTSVNVGTPFTIALSAPNDPSSVDAATLTYAFDCDGDGTFSAPGTVPNTLCTLTTPGSYTVAGRVLDKDGASTPYSGSGTIVGPVNLPPTLSVGGPYSGAEGASITLGASGSDPEGQPLLYSWNFGYGAPAVSGANVTHAFPDDGVYTVTVTVSDGTNSTSATTTATITNVAPTGTIIAPAGKTAPQGGVALSLGNIVDPGALDAMSLQYRFDCGTGFGPAVSSPSTTCALPVTGSVTLRIAVRDKDGGQNTYTKAVKIGNVGPTVTILSPTSVTIGAGSALTFAASFTDPGTADNPWTARVARGKGLGTQSLGAVTPGVPFGASLIYPKRGTFTVQVEVKDKFNAVAQRGQVTVVVQ